VTSIGADYGRFSEQWSYLITKAPITMPIACDTLAIDKLFEGKEGQISVRCPKSCAMSAAPIYGNHFFATSSSVCKAGIFDGAISDRDGGVFSFKIGKAELMFIGDTRNGIVTKELKNMSYTYRSFTIMFINNGRAGGNISIDIDANNLSKSDMIAHIKIIDITGINS
jgi:hypothetical protein